MPRHVTCCNRRRMFCRFRAWLVTLTALLVVATVQAEPLSRLDLAESMRRAEAFAPALGPRRAAVSGARSVESAADSVLALPPRVEVGVGPRWRATNRDTGLEANLAIWQDLSLGGFGSSRRRFASTLSSEARARLEVSRREVRMEAALAWVEARLARELVRIRKDSLARAEEILQVASARVRAGSVAPSEESLARALVGNAKGDFVAAQGKRFVADAELRYTTGLPAGAPIDVVGSLDVKDAPLALKKLLADVRAAQPDVKSAEASAERSARAAEMSWASGRPFLAVGPLVTREATGDWILLARVGFPLPLVNPAGVDAARARLDASVASAEVRHVRALLERDLTLALEEREHARELRDVVRNGVLGPARDALRVSLAQYEAGKIDTASVLAARREQLQAEDRWAEAAADVRRADIRLARLVGREPWELGGKGQ